MHKIGFLTLSMFLAASAHADFSYITVTKSPAGEHTSKHYIKGQKMINDEGDTVIVMDLDAQTLTTVNKVQKTYSVKAFSELSNTSAMAGTNVNADIKKTGQRKTINGFDAEESVVTMAMQNNQPQRGGRGQSMQMQMEMHIWSAADVPGIEEARAFYQKNADRMPWAAMAGGMSGMAEIQRKLATMHGITVMTVVKMTANPQQQAQMEQARARLEEMKKQGGPQAAMADQLLARMGGGPNEVTSESSGFSASPVPDSVFEIPAGYRKVDK